MEPFHDPPAVILATKTRGALKIYFLKIVLAHVGDEKIIGLTENEKAMGSQPRAPIFGRNPAAPTKGFSRARCMCGFPSRHRCAESSEQVVAVLRAMLGPTRSTITCAM